MNFIGPGARLLTINASKEYISNPNSDSHIFTIFGGANATFSGLMLTGNNSGGMYGGALYNYTNGNLTVNACIITENSAQNYGGGIDTGHPSSWTNIYGSTISGNTAMQYYGGGIMNYGLMSLTNSTVAGNTADQSYGGGIYNGGSLDANSSTISANSASHGGGILNGNFLAAYNSIIAGNTSGGASGGDCEQCLWLDTSNMVGSAPQLSPLQINGSSTAIPTMIPLPGSAAIGYGKASLNSLTADQRGFQRMNGTILDVGAVQTNYAAVEFVRQPTDAVVNTLITTFPAVAVFETNYLDSSSDMVNGIPMTLGFSGGKSEIAGTLTETTASGVATFSDLSVNTAGTGYTLFIASPILNGTLVNSSSFDVTNPVAATPTFSLASGTYTSVQSVTLSDTTSGATIYYTIDGSTPTAASTKYTGAITVSATETIQAIAIAPGYSTSATASATYTINMPAVLTTPTPGSTLASSAATFTWSKGSSVTAYKLILGTTAGGSDLYNSYSTIATTETVKSLPTNGKTIYATLYSQIAGTWNYSAYTYTAAGTTTSTAALTTPAPGSTLTGSTATFTWTKGTNVTAYKLILGTTAGGSDLYNSYSTAATTETVKNLPTNGTSIYATLYSQIGGIWYSNAYTFTTASPAQLTTPTPGSTLASGAVLFTWNKGIGVTAYKLILGTTKGASDLYNSYSTTATTKTVKNLPTNGATIYATLYSQIGGIWYSNACAYTAYTAK